MIRGNMSGRLKRLQPQPQQTLHRSSSIGHTAGAVTNSSSSDTPSATKTAALSIANSCAASNTMPSSDGASGGAATAGACGSNSIKATGRKQRKRPESGSSCTVVPQQVAPTQPIDKIPSSTQQQQQQTQQPLNSSEDEDKGQIWTPKHLGDLRAYNRSASEVPAEVRIRLTIVCRTCLSHHGDMENSYCFKYDKLLCVVLINFYQCQNC